MNVLLKNIFTIIFSISLVSCSSNPAPLESINLSNTVNVLDSSKPELKKTNSGFYSTGILKIKNEADIKKTISALKELKASTTKEVGNLDFVILQDKSDLTRIIIWEHFKTEDAFKKHLDSEHLKKFLGLNLVDFVVGYPAQIIA